MALTVSYLIPNRTHPLLCVLSYSVSLRRCNARIASIRAYSSYTHGMGSCKGHPEWGWKDRHFYPEILLSYMCLLGSSFSGGKIFFSSPLGSIKLTLNRNVFIFWEWPYNCKLSFMKEKMILFSSQLFPLYGTDISNITVSLLVV